jgi:hypothetical protein
VLCRYIFAIKDAVPSKAVTIVGNTNILWQTKSFENLKKIWDKLTVKFLPPAGQASSASASSMEG